MAKALLIISCSARKKNLGRTTAWQCYDGMTFRILKKIDRDGGLPGNLDIAIVSAKYGLLSPQSPIEYYDQKMTRTDATRMRPQVLEGLSRLMLQNRYAEVFVNMGKQYLPAIEGLDQRLPGVHVVYATGGIGQKGAAMKRWVMRLHLPSD
jgi:hypothetical protein